MGALLLRELEEVLPPDDQGGVLPLVHPPPLRQLSLRVGSVGLPLRTHSGEHQAISLLSSWSLISQ